MNTLRDTLTSGQPSFGSWVSIGGAVAGETMGRAGYDWVICDLQHGGLGWEALLPTIQALELGHTPALVRVGWNDPAQIMRALDLGAAGVIVPMVSDARAAHAAVRAVRYPPHGERSFGQVRSYYAADARTPPDPLCLVMIETKEALDNLEAIAAVPGLDGLFVGPVDLALSLGLGPALQMPDQVLAAIDDVVATCARHQLIPGCPSLGNGQALVEKGVRLLPMGSDAGHIRRSAASDLAQARSWPTHPATQAAAKTGR